MLKIIIKYNYSDTNHIAIFTFISFGVYMSSLSVPGFSAFLPQSENMHVRQTLWEH